MQKKQLTLVILPLSTFLLASVSQARLNTFTAGVSTGYDYNKTDYERELVEENIPIENRHLEKLSIGPIFILESSSSIDHLSINYNPSYTYDLESSNSDVDHRFSLSTYRDFSKKLHADLDDTFLYSDDPALIETDNSSDYNRGRRRYWTNTFNIGSSYSYDTGSSFGGGYSYKVLRNDDTGIGGYEDYDKHIGDLFVNHTINASWNVGATISYTRGLFDPPDQEVVERVEAGLESISEGITDNIDTTDISNDLEEYRATASVNWIVDPRKTLQLNYAFSESDYDAPLRPNTNLHNLTLGAQYQHTPRLSFGLGGGPSYEKTETFDPNWGYNAHVDLNYDVAKHSTLSAKLDKGYDQENFSSNNNQLGRDRGLTEFWGGRLDFSHQLLEDLSLRVNASYRDELQENIVHGILSSTEDGIDLQSTDRETFREESVFNRDIYQFGSGLTYKFMEYWTSAINYSYRKQESERINDSYDEHRVYLTLSVQKEIWRW